MWSEKKLYGMSCFIDLQRTYVAEMTGYQMTNNDRV